jgi:hypothetical protein
VEGFPPNWQIVEGENAMKFRNFQLDIQLCPRLEGEPRASVLRHENAWWWTTEVRIGAFKVFCERRKTRPLSPAE